MSIAYRSSLPLASPETATAKAADLLSRARQKLGFVPNMYAVMVNSPALLEIYQLGSQRFRD